VRCAVAPPPAPTSASPARTTERNRFPAIAELHAAGATR
jgi:hypothetical protein